MPLLPVLLLYDDDDDDDVNQRLAGHVPSKLIHPSEQAEAGQWPGWSARLQSLR